MARTTIPMAVKNLLNINVCANHPQNQAVGCKHYHCPMWIYNEGRFDESGYQIDHIIEVTHGGTNELTNLQVLCPSCHSVKTKRCAKTKWMYNSEELDIGVGPMDCSVGTKRKRI